MTRLLSAAAAAVAANKRPRRILPQLAMNLSIAERAMASARPAARPILNRFMSSSPSSSAAAAAPTTARPRIISRRALEHHLPRHPQLVAPPPPRSSKKVDDTPWPLPMRIAGYVALALTVPYTVATLIAGSEGLRDGLEGDRPDLEEDRYWGKMVVGFVREYWGKEEGRSYPEWLGEQKRLARGEWAKTSDDSGSTSSRAERVEGVDKAEKAKSEKKEAVIKSFESEMPYLSHAVRSAQIEIERLRHSPVVTRITLNPDGEMGGCAERTLQGDIPADAGILRGIMSDAGVALGAGEDDAVAVDFVDEEEPEAPITAGAIADEIADAGGMVGGEFAAEDEEHPAARALRRLTYAFSTWHYDPTWETSASSAPASKSAQSSSSSKGYASAPAAAPASSSDNAFDRLRLKELDERAIQLAKDLRDPACTRDLDDVNEELRRVKAEARKLRGWGGTVRGWFGRS